MSLGRLITENGWSVNFRDGKATKDGVERNVLGVGNTSKLMGPFRTYCTQREKQVELTRRQALEGRSHDAQAELEDRIAEMYESMASLMAEEDSTSNG